MLFHGGNAHFSTVNVCGDAEVCLYVADYTFGYISFTILLNERVCSYAYLKRLDKMFVASTKSVQIVCTICWAGFELAYTLDF